MRSFSSAMNSFWHPKCTRIEAGVRMRALDFSSGRVEGEEGGRRNSDATSFLCEEAGQEVSPGAEAWQVEPELLRQLKGCTQWRAASEIGWLTASGCAAAGEAEGPGVASEGVMLAEAQLQFDWGVRLLQGEFAGAIKASEAGEEMCSESRLTDSLKCLRK